MLVFGAQLVLLETITTRFHGELGKTGTDVLSPFLVFQLCWPYIRNEKRVFFFCSMQYFYYVDFTSVLFNTIKGMNIIMKINFCVSNVNINKLERHFWVRALNNKEVFDLGTIY